MTGLLPSPLIANHRVMVVLTAWLHLLALQSPHTILHPLALVLEIRGTTLPLRLGDLAKFCAQGSALVGVELLRMERRGGRKARQNEGNPGRSTH